VGNKDHRLVGSESGRVERRHEVAVPSMDGRNQSAPIGQADCLANAAMPGLD